MNRLTQLFLGLVMALGIGTPAAFGASLCFSMHLDTSSTSWDEAKMRVEGSAYVWVNDRPVSFRTNMNTVIYKQVQEAYVQDGVTYYNKKTLAQKSTANGCVDSSVFMPGDNTIKVWFCYANANDECVPANGMQESRFVMQEGTSGSREICRISRSAGQHSVGTCQKTISLPLNEIDPQLASQIASLEAQVKSSKEAYDDAVEGLEAALARVGELEAMLAQDIENMDPAAISAMQIGLEGAASMVRDLQKTVADLRTQILADQAQLEATARGAGASALAQAAETLGLDPSDPALYAMYPTDGYVVPTITLPPPPFVPDAFDPASNAYRSYRERFTALLADALARDDRRTYLSVVSRWNALADRLEVDIDVRGPSVSPAERQAMQEHFAAVDASITAQIDDFGFFRDIAASLELKNHVRSIAQYVGSTTDAQAILLRDALNELHGVPVAHQDEILKTVASVASSFAFWSDPRLSDAHRTKLREGLRSVTTEAIAVIEHGLGKLTCPTSRTVISFATYWLQVNSKDPCTLQPSPLRERALVGGVLGAAARDLWRSNALATTGRHASTDALTVAEAMQVTGDTP